MTRIIARLGCIIIMLCSVVSCVVVPHRPVDPPQQVDPLGQCLQDNRRDHADVWQLYQQAKSAGRISSGEARQFQAMEGRLNAIKNSLSRNGLSLYDCDRIGQEIANERANVQRMAATPAYNPQLAQCIQDNRRDHADVWQLFQQARSAGRISPVEARQFRAMEGRLNTIKNSLSRNGLSLYDCDRISREIANERATVQRMAATPAHNPQLVRCIQDNRRDHEDVWQLFQRAKSAGRISPGEARQFQAMEGRLNAIKGNLSRDGLTLSDCDRISREIANERATVQRMAATPTHNPQLVRCIQDNRRDHEEVWQLFQRARSAGRISPAEARQFQAMEGRLNAIKGNLSRDGLTLSDCDRISREIDKERKIVQRMTATPR
jgi:hypothetical protein